MVITDLEGTQNMQQPPNNPKYDMVAGDWAITPNNWFNEKPINSSPNRECQASTVTVKYELGTITYKNNSLGYRGADFTGNGGVIGDSFVYGIGVTNPFAQQLNIDNLGSPAGSNDEITKTAIQYINNFKPPFIIICWTYAHRREWVDENFNTSKIFRRADWHNHSDIQPTDVELAFAEISNDGYNYYTWLKNKMLLELFCDKNFVQLIQVHNNIIWRENIEYDYGYAMDNLHPGQGWHDEMTKYLKEKLKNDA